jgi:hypothetical protein
MGTARPFDSEIPFRTFDDARREGRIRTRCLGVVLDAPPFAGEILTVAVFEPETFDELAGDFVDTNDEGSVVHARVPFTEQAIHDLLSSGQVAPAGASCIHLAWLNRQALLGDALS